MEEILVEEILGRVWSQRVWPVSQKRYVPASLTPVSSLTPVFARALRRRFVARSDLKQPSKGSIKVSVRQYQSKRADKKTSRLAQSGWFSGFLAALELLAKRVPYLNLKISVR